MSHKDVRKEHATFGFVSSSRKSSGLIKRTLKLMGIVVIIGSLVVVMIVRHFFKL